MNTIEQQIVLTDDPDLVEVIESSFFGREGYSLKKVSSGPEAFKFIEEEAPVLAILSLGMEKFGGEECFRMVKKDPFLCLLPVILISNNSPWDRKKCKDAGCDNVIVRPIDSWALISMCCQLLNIVGRASPRRRVSIPVHWGPKDDGAQSGTIVDINSGGMFIHTENYLPPDKSITLKFTLPEVGRTVCCQGKVAWINHPEWIKSMELPAGMGICFSSISEKDRTAVQLYLQQKKAG
jgi:CheY-like chemotaxis protein